MRTGTVNRLDNLRKRNLKAGGWTTSGGGGKTRRTSRSANVRVRTEKVRLDNLTREIETERLDNLEQ